VLARLDEDADRYETHVVITADHGESWGEDNSFGHRRRVTRFQVHVPCIVTGPRVAAQHRDEPAGSVDLYATLLALGGVSGGDGPGRDLLAPPDGRPVFAAGMRPSLAAPVHDPRLNGRSVLIEGDQFFLARGDGHFIGNPEMLPGGGNDADPKLLAEVAATFAAFRAELRASQSEELVDDETRAALDALGYTK